jgi:hypothetical protein
MEWHDDRIRPNDTSGLEKAIANIEQNGTKGYSEGKCCAQMVVLTRWAPNTNELHYHYRQFVRWTESVALPLQLICLVH